TSWWRRMTASPWRAALVIAVIGVGMWWAASGWSGSRSATAPAAHHASARSMTLASSAGSEEAAAGAHGAKKEEGPEKFPNVITVLERAFPEAGWAQFLHRYEAIIYSLLIALILCLVATTAARNPQM